MILHIFISIFIYQVVACYENNERAKNLGYEVVGSDYREGNEKILRPCGLDGNIDYECMRRFLSYNSRCIPPSGSPLVPDPIYLPIERFFIPVASMTITHLDAAIRGFRKAKITDFYLNKATGNVVIAVLMPTYNLTGNSFYSFRRVGKEPISLNDYSTFEVDNIWLTAAIPKVPHLRLDLADIHAFTYNSGARAYIGSNALKSSDPDVKARFAEFNKNIGTVIKEVYTFHAYLLMTTFIQDMLCDFELKAYLNYDGFALGKCSFESVK